MTTKTLSKAVVMLLVALLPALSSCKKEATDVSDLLSKVPSSASSVVGINLGSLLEKAGCKVDGSEIEAGPEIEKWIDSQKEYMANQKETMKLFLSGESGIDPVGAVFFTDAYGSYITAMVADAGKFIDFVKKETGNEFVETDGVKTAANIAMVGAQMWINLTNGNTIDPVAVKNYAALDEAQSFMQNPFAGSISNMTSDIVGWGQIRAFINKGMSFGDLTMLNMATGMLFEDAYALSLTFNFLEGKLEGNVSVLNDKGELAKYLLPADKLDTDDIKSLCENAELVGGVSITKKMMEKIEKVGSSLGGSLFGPMIKALGSLDGTVAVALADIDSPENGIRGVVTTDGNPSLDMMNLLNMLAPTKKDGKLVTFSKGEMKGGLVVKDVADYLKGATLGIVTNATASDINGDKEGIKTVAFKISPDKDGIVANVTVTGIDPEENMLMTLLKHNTK